MVSSFLFLYFYSSLICTNYVFTFFHKSNVFVHCACNDVFLRFFFYWEKPFQLVFYSVSFYVVMLYFLFSKGRRFGTVRTFNPSAIVCTCPKSGIWCSVVVVCLCCFLYWLDRWVSRLNGFTLVILEPFIACCFVLKTEP